MLDKTCINQRCSDPCPGTCGIEARCHVVNHSPICSCKSGYTGDPFIRCVIKEESKMELFHTTKIDFKLYKHLIGTPVVENPCEPTPCGSNSQCRQANGQAVCSCLPNYVGAPPYCRPECVQNSECPSNLACFNMKCKDPCPGLCGVNALCSVTNHQGNCHCQTAYTGDPFAKCSPIPPCKKSRCELKASFIRISTLFSRLSVSPTWSGWTL